MTDEIKPGGFLNFRGMAIKVREKGNMETVVDVKAGETIHHGKSPIFLIDEGATNNGKLNVTFIVKIHGGFATVELTQGLFESAIKAFEEAKQKFNI